MSFEQTSGDTTSRNMDEGTPSKRLKLSDQGVSSMSSPMFFSSPSRNNSIVLYKPVTANNDPVSMDELVRSPAIVLTIGPEEVQTTVQASLFRGISEPLHNLLNHTYGNPSAINEVLKHDDKDAFLALVSMAYSVVLKGSQAQNMTLATTPTATSNNGAENVVKKMPKCPDCRKSSVRLVLACPSCNPKLNDADLLGLGTFFELQFTQQGPPAVPQNLVRGGIPLSAPLDSKDKFTGRNYSLLHFAKVFALATKYEVWGLQFSAVKAFDRRLRKYANDDGKTSDELIEALKYLASAMGNATSPPVSPSTVDSFDARMQDENTISVSYGINPTTLLRRLLRYVVAHVEVLLKEDDFREIVVEYGIIGLELMNVLKESMATFSG